MIEEIQNEVKNNITPLVEGIATDFQELMEKEMTLAKQEIKEEISQVKSYASSLIEALIGIMLATLMLCFMLVHLLVENYPSISISKSFGIVTLLLSIISTMLCIKTSSAKKKLTIIPEKTVKSLKEVLNG